MATSTDLRAAIEEVQSQLPESEAAGEGVSEAQLDADWTTRMERRIGALPWWVISAAVHAVIFLLATLLTVAAPAAQLDEVVIQTEVAKQEEKKYDEKLKRDLFKQHTEIRSEQQVEKPMVVHEEREIAETFQTDNNMESQTARGHEDAISDIPLGGTGISGSIGVGGGGMAGCFGYRDGGGRKMAVGRFGGSPATESAVEAALRWLARHQEPDGHWDPAKWDKGRGPVGMTGMALLAFLGAGHTEKAGQFRDNVRRAQAWLVNHLDERANQKGITCKYGFFYCDMYQQGMATLALAEAYGMTADPKLQKPAQAAVDYVVSAAGPYEVWNYSTKNGQAGRNDTSVSGWSLMALKSAKIAGLKVDGASFQGCMNWLNAATKPQDGRCAYAGTMGQANPGNGSMAMCAAGMLMRQFIGADRGEPVLKAAADTLAKNLPAWEGGNAGQVNFYYWYYGTLCMFQMGGQHWEKWNTAMKKSLLDNQRKGGPMDGTEADVDGSWDPVGGGHVPAGGRVFSTALGALSLEVYYRYLPLYTK